MTPAAELAPRIGDSTSLRLLYLSNTLFRPECSSRGEPHSPFTRPRLPAQCHRHCPLSPWNAGPEIVETNQGPDANQGVFSGPGRSLPPIDARASRFGPVIFTDSLSERSRWIENTNFTSSWRETPGATLPSRTPKTAPLQGWKRALPCTPATSRSSGRPGTNGARSCRHLFSFENRDLRSLQSGSNQRVPGRHRGSRSQVEDQCHPCPMSGLATLHQFFSNYQKPAGKPVIPDSLPGKPVSVTSPYS